MPTPDKRVYVDTSALIAILNADDRFHTVARNEWGRLVSGQFGLWTTNYVVVEATALVQRRMGMEGAASLHDSLLPVIAVHWIDAQEHETGVAMLFAARRRELSLVDCCSFVVMRALGIDAALTLDPHFREQGYRLLPVTSPRPPPLPAHP